MKEGKMNCAGGIRGEKKNVYVVLVGEPKGKKSLVTWS
jgi:hypothetical protein